METAPLALLQGVGIVRVCVCACVHSCTGTFSFNSSLVNKSIEYTVYEVEPVLYFRELQIYLWPTRHFISFSLLLILNTDEIVLLG